MKIFEFLANFSQNLKTIFYCPLFPPPPHGQKSGYGPGGGRDNTSFLSQVIIISSNLTVYQLILTKNFFLGGGGRAPQPPGPPMWKLFNKLFKSVWNAKKVELNLLSSEWILRGMTRQFTCRRTSHVIRGPTRPRWAKTRGTVCYVATHGPCICRWILLVMICGWEKDFGRSHKAAK